MLELLEPVLIDSLQNYDEKGLINILLLNSNLSGRRANLEMSSAFVELCEKFTSQYRDELFDILTKLFGYNTRFCDTNDPCEFLSFCATQALGIDEAFEYFGSERLGIQASDYRWRIREATAMAIQRLIITQNKKMIVLFTEWIKSNDYLKCRAIIAGYAHPEVLDTAIIRQQAFMFHDHILTKLMVDCDKSENLDTLVKALKYTISVLVVSDPKCGFSFIHKWIKEKNKIIDSIIKRNLKKNRLVKKFPTQVKELELLL